MWTNGLHLRYAVSKSGNTIDFEQPVRVTYRTSMTDNFPPDKRLYWQLCCSRSTLHCCIITMLDVFSPILSSIIIISRCGYLAPTCLQTQSPLHTRIGPLTFSHCNT